MPQAAAELAAAREAAAALEQRMAAAQAEGAAAARCAALCTMRRACLHHWFFIFPALHGTALACSPAQPAHIAAGPASALVQAVDACFLAHVRDEELVPPASTAVAPACRVQHLHLLRRETCLNPTPGGRGRQGGIGGRGAVSAGGAALRGGRIGAAAPAGAHGRPAERAAGA